MKLRHIFNKTMKVLGCGYLYLGLVMILIVIISMISPALVFTLLAYILGTLYVQTSNIFPNVNVALLLEVLFIWVPVVLILYFTIKHIDD